MSRSTQRSALAVAAAVTLAPAAAGAWVLSEDVLEERSTALGVIARSFAFVLAGDVLAPPYSFTDVNPTATGLFDARLYFSHKTPDLKLVAHNQLTLKLLTDPLPAALSFGRGAQPPRWLPLSFEEMDPTLTLRSDADWLYAAYTIAPVTITLGRQPVSFGRGSLWRTADLISTFSLTEVDTEYKPGADVLRIDIAPAERTNLTALAAIGELGLDEKEPEHDLEAELRASSFIAQVRQGFEWGELGLIGGFVRYDGLVGLDGVVDFGDFDIYAEVAATWVTEESLASPMVTGEDRAVPVMKALAGATFRPVGSLTLKPEIYYNGFGSFEAADYLRIAFSERVSVGEQVGFGKIYLGLTNDWEARPLTHLVTAMIVNGADPSGLLSLAVHHSIAQNVDGILGTYLPLGYLPDTSRLIPAPRSEYGSYPAFFFCELKGTI